MGEEDQPEAGGRALLLCQQRHPPHLRHHGLSVSGAPRGGLLPVHCLLRWVGLRQRVDDPQIYVCVNFWLNLTSNESKWFRFGSILNQKLEWWIHRSTFFLFLAILYWKAEWWNY